MRVERGVGAGENEGRELTAMGKFFKTVRESVPVHPEFDRSSATTVTASVLVWRWPSGTVIGQPFAENIGVVSGLLEL